MYQKSYIIPLTIDEAILTSGAGSESDRVGNLGVRGIWDGSPVGKKIASVKRKVKSPEIGEVISVKKDLRMEMEKREKERRDREKENREREQRERAKREREGSAEKERKKKRRRTVTEIQETDADDDDLISPVDARRDSNATDSTGTVLAGGMSAGFEGFEDLELIDLAGREDSADSDYVEEVSEFSSENEEEDEEDEEEEETIGTSKRRKILLDSSQSSPSPSLRASKPQKRGTLIYVPKGEPKNSRRRYTNDFDESSDSSSVSPSARSLTPRGGKQRVSPYTIGSKSKKQRINSSGYTLPPINTDLTSPSRSHHRPKPSQSPDTSLTPIPQPPCLRMSLTGNDKDIFTIPLSEVLTPAELEKAIQSHFPQPTDTYIKLTDGRGDIIKLSYWKGGVWKDGLRVRVEYRDNISGGSGSKTSAGAVLGSRGTSEKLVKIGMVDAEVQTDEVEVYAIGWAKERKIEIVQELTEQLQMKVDQEIAERTEMKVKEEREFMELKREQERERERDKFREEKERLQKEREEFEELELELQFGSQPKIKEALPLLSADALPKSEKSMPTPNTTAHTSRNSSTDLATPTEVQFTALSPSLAVAARPEPPPKQRQHTQKQEASPKKWRPSTDADVGSDSGSDLLLDLDLSWDSQKKRVASAEKQKSKSKLKPMGGHNSSLTQKSRECSLSLNSTPVKSKGRSVASPSTGYPAAAQGQEEPSLFLGPSQLTDSSTESSPRVRTPLSSGLTLSQENFEVRRQARLGENGLARGGGVIGSAVGCSGGNKATEAEEGREGKKACQEWYPLGGWVMQRPGEMDPKNKK